MLETPPLGGYEFPKVDMEPVSEETRWSVALQDKVYVAPSSIHGLGVFAARDLPKNVHILDYEGPIVGPEQKKRMVPRDKDYLWKVDDDGHSIDGRFGLIALQSSTHSPIYFPFPRPILILVPFLPIDP